MSSWHNDTPYVLFILRTNGENEYYHFSGRMQAVDAFDASVKSDNTQTATIKRYGDHDSQDKPEIIRDWSRPSIFNLETAP